MKKDTPAYTDLLLELSQLLNKQDPATLNAIGAWLKTGDLRKLLLRLPLDREDICLDCLHFIGDEGQHWYAHREGYQELIEITSEIFQRLYYKANSSLRYSELEALHEALKKSGVEFSFPPKQ